MKVRYMKEKEKCIRRKVKEMKGKRAKEERMVKGRGGER